jgi:hypothetical protein
LPRHPEFWQRQDAAGRHLRDAEEIDPGAAGDGQHRAAVAADFCVRVAMCMACGRDS